MPPCGQVENLRRDVDLLRGVNQPRAGYILPHIGQFNPPEIGRGPLAQHFALRLWYKRSCSAAVVVHPAEPDGADRLCPGAVSTYTSAYGYRPPSRAVLSSPFEVRSGGRPGSWTPRSLPERRRTIFVLLILGQERPQSCFVQYS